MNLKKDGPLQALENYTSSTRKPKKHWSQKGPVSLGQTKKCMISLMTLLI